MSNEKENRSTRRRRSSMSSEESSSKKGNLTVQEAGKMGGQKVRKLVQEGKEHENE